MIRIMVYITRQAWSIIVYVQFFPDNDLQADYIIEGPL